MAAPKIWCILKNSNGKNITLHRRHTNFDLGAKTSALLLLEFEWMIQRHVCIYSVRNSSNPY
ncbi:hypothetical protein BH18THE1_BH18THE1_07160 [soil metagenome]